MKPKIITFTLTVTGNNTNTHWNMPNDSTGLEKLAYLMIVKNLMDKEINNLLNPPATRKSD